LYRSNDFTSRTPSMSAGTAFCRLGRRFFFASATISLAVAKVISSPASVCGCYRVPRSFCLPFSSFSVA
jgi:hypothetical protein